MKIVITKLKKGLKMSIQPNSPARSSYSDYNVLNDVSNRVKGEKTRECASVLEQNTKPESSDFMKVVGRIRKRNQRKLSSWQQKNKEVPLSEVYNLRRSAPNTPVIAKVVSPIIPIRTQEIDAEIALAEEMQQRTRQTTASAPQTQSTTRAAARVLRKEKQAVQQAEKEQREAALKKEALDKAWSDLSAFDGFETEKDFVKNMPSDETARINTSHWKDFGKKDHVEILFEKTREERRKNQKKYINSLNVGKIKELVIEKLRKFIPSESEIDFLNYAIEKLGNNEDHITNPRNSLSKFFKIISPKYVNAHISDFHSDKSVESRMRDLKTKIQNHYYSLDGYIKLINNPSLLLKLIFMKEGNQKNEESSKRIASIFLRNLESLDSEEVISLNNKIKKEQEKYNNTLSFYSGEIIRIINRKAENIIDKTKLAEKHITPETTTRLQKKLIQPIQIDPAAVLEEHFSSKTSKELTDEVIKLFKQYRTGTCEINEKNNKFLNYSVGESGRLTKTSPHLPLLNKIILECTFVRSAHPCAEFMENIKSVKKELENNNEALKATAAQAQRAASRALKAQKEQAEADKKAQKEQAEAAKKAAQRNKVSQRKAETDTQAVNVLRTISPDDYLLNVQMEGSDKLELPELEKPILDSEIGDSVKTISSDEAVRMNTSHQDNLEPLSEEQARQNNLQWYKNLLSQMQNELKELQTKNHENSGLLRRFVWTLCSKRGWNTNKKQVLSDIEEVSKKILGLLSNDELRKVGSSCLENGGNPICNGDSYFIVDRELVVAEHKNRKESYRSRGLKIPRGLYPVSPGNHREVTSSRR